MTTPSEQPDSQLLMEDDLRYDIPPAVRSELRKLRAATGTLSRQRDALKAALEGISARLLFASWLESISGKARTEIKSIADDISALAQLSTQGGENVP